VAIKFTWDPGKAAANLRKHGVSFDEASTAFADLLSIAVPDRTHSDAEARWLLVGLTHRGRLVVVAHLDLHDQIRIISARLATTRERHGYEEEA